MKAQDDFSKKGTINFAVGALLLLLPGCDWFGKEETKPKPGEERPATEQAPFTGEVLVSWQGGVPLITTDSLQVEKDKLLKTNPQLKTMIAFMDEKQLDRNLSEGLTNQATIDKWVKDKKMDASPDYQTELKEGFKAVERMINTKFFTQAFPVEVADAEIKNFYEI